MALRGRAKTVYSSEHGRMCPHCGLAADHCLCRANPRASSPIAHSDGDGIARVGLSRKGRGGKTVTTLSGLQLPQEELRELARALKRRCGTGGAVKRDVIEIQGDQRDVLVAELEKRGFRARRSGG